MTSTIDAGSFYSEYKGHPIKDLEAVHAHFCCKKEGEKETPTTIFLTGDSSLDNKHWFFDPYREKDAQIKITGRGGGGPPSFVGAAVNGYEHILQPPRMVKDVAYWMNALAAERFKSGSVVTINASVEESTVGERVQSSTGLLPHDEFVRDHTAAGDVVVCSVGGNAVALKPTVATIAAVFALTRSPMWMIRTFGPWTPGWGHMEAMFHDRIEEMVQRILASPNGTPPRKVVVCMIYYLDEKPGGSWADFTLDKLGYNVNPEKLQLIIRMLFERIRARGFSSSRPPSQGGLFGLFEKGGTQTAQVAAAAAQTEVLAFPLFEVLDGKNTEDYVQRVEPSVQGGKKMAEALLNFIFDEQ